MAVALRQVQVQVRALTLHADGALGCCFIDGPVDYACAMTLRRAGQLKEYSPLELEPPFLSFFPALALFSF